MKVDEQICFSLPHWDLESYQRTGTCVFRWDTLRPKQKVFARLSPFADSYSVLFVHCVYVKTIIITRCMFYRLCIVDVTRVIFSTHSLTFIVKL